MRIVKQRHYYKGVTW